VETDGLQEVSSIWAAVWEKYKNLACSMIYLKYLLFYFVFLITQFKLLNLGMKAKLRQSTFA